MYNPVFEELLKERKTYLEEVIKDKDSAVKNAVSGKLRIITRGCKTYYYRRIKPSDTNGTYISKDNYELAAALAQKEYDEKILKLAKAELARLQRLESISSDIRIEDYFTYLGDRVRSKSELLIAKTLDQMNIPYRYECGLYLPGYGMVYPDFTALNVRRRRDIIWEHLGMMDNPEYARKALYKISLYEKNGFIPGDRLIITHETSERPLNSNLIYQMIELFLK